MQVKSATTLNHILTCCAAIAASPLADGLLAAESTPAPPETVSYAKDIRPILSDRCFLCHGPDENTREQGLRLDIRDEAIDYAIVPGNAEDSDAFMRIVSDEEGYAMPPEGSHKARLTPEEVALFKKWINDGAKYEQHWAFLAPAKPSTDPARISDWDINPIDRLVLKKLDEQGVEPSPKADRRTLLRRAALDLTGLPPTRQQIAEFLDDTSPDAWSRALDRLLASPAYGEQQAKGWLDVARYADSNGYQYDRKRDQWAWRDWVIASFNDNQPFDKFTVEQLAGDLLPNATPRQRLATGFNRNHPITIEGGVIDEEYRTEYVLDRTTTAGTAWLGLTLGCARCHSHKYDPISQTEFYQISAFFNQVPEKGMQGFDPKERIVSPLQEAELEELSTRLADAKQKFHQAVDAWMPDESAIVDRLSDYAERGWDVIPPTSATSSAGATLNLIADGSVVATGENPEKDEYVIEFDLDDQPVHCIRLVALPGDDEQGLVGRSANGNFVLSEVELELATDQGRKKFSRVDVADAYADYSQDRYDIENAIDGQVDSRGWAVHGPTGSMRLPKSAYFVPASVVQPRQGGRLRMRLKFQSQYSQHQMAKFRIDGARSEPTAYAVHAIDILRTSPTDRTDDQRLALVDLAARALGPARVRDAHQELVTARDAYESRATEAPETMIMRDLPTPRKTYRLERGEYDKRKEEVVAGTPAFLPPMPAELPRNRLGFAKWLTMPDHPLTSRVAVNRFWIQLFGIGLVETPEDFGLQSALPSHPELLDWLAVEFIESGWDVKHLLKTIMLSETYQQSSAVTPETFEADPENRLLARGPRLRLDAETIRDSALSVSGLLNREVGGPSVFPYHPKGLWLEVNNRPGYSSAYEQDSGEKLYRRGLYTFWKRTVPPPSMAVFDAPSREYCQVRRSRTNTPLQAFVLLHDPQFVEAARALAGRMLTEGGLGSENQIVFGFEAAVGRRPSADELQVLQNVYDERLAMYQRDPDKAVKLLSIGESRRNEEITPSEHAAMTTVARLIFNLSEFITKG